ncbi:hypothetical protein LGM65_30980 [Burkholderia anthina]|uniref:ExbD/TolR family protein n=1 Tax=Burkholderia anthina TaxID=179879 RepID=UPI001CF49AF4|nr:hypothetical protein [Burkholderia anthina]MCA8095247.1 hypothetical protein [Burkholderia anthina]
MSLVDLHHDDVMSDINMTSLIDGMLVLPIVLKVTLRAIADAVGIDLPEAISTPDPIRAERVAVPIGAVRTRSRFALWNAACRPEQD